MLKEFYRQHCGFFNCLNKSCVLTCSPTCLEEDLLRVTLCPLLESCFLIKPSVRHMCLLTGPQRAVLNSYALPGGLKVNSSQMWSGPSEREECASIRRRWAKSVKKKILLQKKIFRNKKKKKASSVANCVKVILSESHRPCRYADLTYCNHSKNSAPLKFILNSCSSAPFESLLAKKENPQRSSTGRFWGIVTHVIR